MLMSRFLSFVRPSAAVLAGLCLAAPFQAAWAAVHHIRAGEDLQQAVARAQAGDTLKLAAGEYRGRIVIDKPLVLEGPDNRAARIVGDRSGRTVSVHAPDVVLRRLTVTRSGLQLAQMDAGIFLDKSAARALIEQNNILENSVGVYVWGAPDAMVRHNRIVGDTKLRVAERGNGVTLWNAPGTQIIANDISEGRDGIFSNTSTKNVFKDNYFHHLRYAVHYMYTNDSEISGNISENNQIGYALMFSERLKVHGNVAINSRDQGFMLNYLNQSQITGNAVRRADKCVFIYNANYNLINGNYFENCAIGVHFTAAAQGNRFYGNAFVRNQNQVKYVGTRFVDWVYEGRGNFWSDNDAFDLDGDGIGDTAYRPNGIMDQIVWRAPVARLLMNSPAVSIVKWAQSQFPAILPGGVTDTRPLMKLPENAALQNYLKRSKTGK